MQIRGQMGVRHPSDTHLTPEPKMKLVGQNYTTPDLVAKVTGRAKYAEDYRADGMLFCKLLLSPMPHARVRGIDLRAALAMPGVKAILNFTPGSLRVPKGVKLKNVDLTVSLESLSFFLARGVDVPEVS